MNIIFAGTPEFAASSLNAIIDAGHNVIAVYTQPDRPAGRGKKLLASPVKQSAQKHEIPVYQPLSFKDESAQAELAALKPDLMIVAAYGLILPAAVLEIPRLGCVNIHASLLPRWRGAAPIQRAIEAGDLETGITIMQMDVGLDTGDTLLTESCAIQPNESGGSLHDKLSELGATCILRYLDNREALNPLKQDDSLANYAHKLSKGEAKIDWREPATAIERRVRAFNPWPVAFTEVEGERVRILSAKIGSESQEGVAGNILRKDKSGIEIQCGTGTILILKLQLAGSKAISVNDFVNGGKRLLEPGTQLT